MCNKLIIGLASVTDTSDGIQTQDSIYTCDNPKGP